MTQHLLSVWSVEGDATPSAEEMELAYRQVDEFNLELQSAGAWVFAGGLHPSTTATVVRAKDGEVLTTDGPFAETKEQLGGFWIIQVADLDAALAWASKGSVACGGPSRSGRFKRNPASRPRCQASTSRSSTRSSVRSPVEQTALTTIDLLELDSYVPFHITRADVAERKFLTERQESLRPPAPQ